MGVAGSARLLAAGAAWRLTGTPAAGRALTRAAAGESEDERTLAGVLLVRAGDRSVPVVAEALRSGSGSETLVDVLASIGSDAARGALDRTAREAPPRVAAAAAEAVRALDQQRGPDG